MEGATVLYIPKEGADMPIDVAAKNKELVQRLDSNKIIKIINICIKFKLINFNSCCNTLVKTIKRCIKFTRYVWPR